ncbi:MAG: hypothetical protein CL866_00010 [Cycloclasticus sp.]|nr:hypothetical protein [Cycloclasticus sp.]MBG95242.1 hypothetical protein [Cycloclasticus sp.]
MGNGIAYIVLVAWPLIAFYLYRSNTIQVASLWTILGGFMFLAVKTEIDLPMIPPLGKDTVPVISSLIGILFVKNKRFPLFKSLGNLKYLVFLIVAVPFITAGLNGEAVVVGWRYVSGLTYYDGLSSVINQFLLIMPFFIGRAFFRTYEDQLTLFKLLVVAGLLYSLPMLYEVRMSPQLHTTFYGYFPHSFLQQYRSGGFRPVVFMGHGLLVAFFAAVVLISAVALWENKMKIRNFSPAAVSYYLLIVLFFCKSLASLLYGLFAFVLIKRLSCNMQIKAAVVLVSLAMLYPTMSIMKIFPHKEILDIAESIDASRAQSLQYRFDNEALLLEHAKTKFFFGWGGWGRNRYNNLTTDGGWVITVGQFGILGFIAKFGLLAATVFRAFIAFKSLKPEPERKLFSAHVLLIGIIMIDQLPNASLAPWLWLIAGILLGRSEEILAKKETKVVTASKN